jgi:hypothetical protein
VGLEGVLALLDRLRRMYFDPEVGDSKGLGLIEQVIKLQKLEDSNA